MANVPVSTDSSKIENVIMVNFGLLFLNEPLVRPKRTDNAGTADGLAEMAEDRRTRFGLQALQLS